MPTTLLYINSSDYKNNNPQWQSDPYGIYRVRLDTETGALEIVGRDYTAASTNFFHVDGVNNRLFASHRAGAEAGELLAFSIDPASGKLTYLNRQSAGNSAITYVGMSHDKRFVLTVNYASPDCTGRTNVFPVAESGQVLAASQALQYDGHSVNEKRQTCSHPHMIDIDPTGKLVLVPDLGLDKLMLYDIDSATGTLSPHDPPWMELPPGSGPRHFTFHPNGKLLYLLNELLATIQPYRYEGGRLTPLTLLPTLPDDFTEPNTAADIHITPDGRYLYSTNRGHDSIAMCRIEDSGELTLIGRESTRGSHPRFFNLDPAGRFLIVSNQFSHNVLTFRINYATGKLEFTGHEISIPGPSCIYAYVLRD